MDALATRQQPLLQHFSEFLAQQIGLHFPPERWCDLQRGIEAAAQEFDRQDAGDCMQWLLSTPLDRRRIEILARHLTVGETYFFRDPQVFDALQTRILPVVIRSRRQTGRVLRFWSAGCASGEEAYSLAILLQRMIPDFKQWRIDILATDINPQALAKAESAVYNDWSFRNAPDWLKTDYFRQTAKGRYEILPAVRQMVTFAYLNLMEDHYPSLTNHTNAIDIIFCRNVLMYFQPTLAARVIHRHSLSLVDGGWLVTSPTDVPQAMPASMETVYFPGAILHRKNASGTASSTTPEAFVQSQRSDQTSASAITSALPRRPPLESAAKIPPPEPPQSDYQLALALYLQGRYDEAAAQAATAANSRRHQAQAMHLLAKIHANRGDLVTAQQWCMRAIADNRIDPVGHYLMAVVLLEQGQTDDGMQELRRTLYLEPNFVLAHFCLGNLCRQQGKHKQADKHFQNTLLLLKACPPEEILPESEGMTVGRMAEIIRSMSDQELAT
ncbi:MAG: hypothetical protein M0R33_13690 [Methylomonas sp.]|jgi:chemotaxis protein methyltransferase CheR|uniref:CheR family methyltransferase n=1 Tax=Methylomonas sp. TaxID=418 RepID=UPI0025DA43D6|nr:CheR family methyltransferase [Methylomonas sp.]MCK9607488.1 hypothetical protein [Methylomonas sp.]